MSELRTDWLTDRAVLIAANRAARPNEFVEPPVSADRTNAGRVPSCPFCVGNEGRTPPALYEKFDEQGRWCVRVVPNMFPAVSLPLPPGEGRGEGEPEPIHPHPALSQGERVLLQVAEATSPGAGAHEVIIESARHQDRMGALSVDEVRDVLEAYADRLRSWRTDGRFKYGLVFKNQGARAGASMAHLHSQFVAFPFVPSRVEAEFCRAAETYRQSRSCAYCGLIERERQVEQRIVVERDGFIAFCPFASMQPHEMWLLPTRHAPAFEDSSHEELGKLAGVLHVLIARLESLVPNAAYNLMLWTAAWSRGDRDSYHWRLELLPRVTSIAGFEIATGVHINPLAPERAAAQLRPV